MSSREQAAWSVVAIFGISVAGFVATVEYAGLVARIQAAIENVTIRLDVA